MNDLIKSIANMKDEVVFIGSVALVFHGKKDLFNDIDMVVKDTRGLEFLGEIVLFDTKSIFSTSGKRAYIRTDNYTMDIFIEDSLPDFIIHDGIKYATMEHIRLYYTKLLDKANYVNPPCFRETLIKNIENKISYL